MLSFYYEFPPYSLLLNLVIIPLMSVVLGAGLLGSFLCLFSNRQEVLYFFYAGEFSICMNGAAI